MAIISDSIVSIGQPLYWSGDSSGQLGYGYIVGHAATQAKPRKPLKAERAFRLIKRCARVQTESLIANKRHASATAAIMAANAKENGQTGLMEEMGRELVRIGKEVELHDAGYSTYINQKAVYHFAGRAGCSVTAIENYGRPIPDDVAAKLKGARASGLFSGFSILHAGVAMIKTMAQRIQEKDPILFGTVAGQPERFYVIADWVDQWCHLTLSGLLTHPEFTGSLQAADVDQRAIVEDTKQREQLLAETNPRTWLEKLKTLRGL